MATPLPARDIFDGTALPVTSAMKAAMGSLRDYLAEQLGTTGGAPTAITSINGGSIAGVRNRIRNGACRVSQEGPIAAAAGVYTYGGADAHCVSINATLTSGTIAQLTSGASVGAHGCSQAITATTSTAGNVLFQHRIAANNVQDLNGKTITISCKAYQDTGSTISTATLHLAKPTTTVDTFSAQTVLQTSANQSIPSGVLTPLSWTITLGASDATLGLAPTLYIPFPSSITGKSFSITDWQLEIGSVATALETVDFDHDMLRCKRTLECFLAGSIDFIGNNYQAGQNNSYTMPMKVSKHLAPTAVSGAYTVFNAAAPTLSISTADNVVLNVANTAAGQWRITNSSIVKIRCDL